MALTAAGAVGGGIIGGAMTSCRGCDDPGSGALVGIPIGALVGGIVGAVLASR